MKIRVVPVRVNADNYAYLVHTNPATNECAAVDPCEPEKLVARASELGWTISAVLTTHHHADHSGGNLDLLRIAKSKLPVFGGDDRIPGLTQLVSDGVEFALGALTVKPLFTACHTRGSVSYFIDSAVERVVFTGDTLFVAGCGRFFEGTPEEMHKSLNSILANLPNDTRVYCGHEYTASNLRFAASVDPENTDIIAKLKWAAENSVTVPSTIGEEKKINPFMRVGVEGLAKTVLGEGGKKGDPVEVMRVLREMKNNFRG